MSESSVTELRPASPAPLPLDPTINDRITEIQRAAFRTTAAVEMVRQYLLAHNSMSLGAVGVATLADALEIAALELDGITDGLDTVNLCRASKVAA